MTCYDGVTDGANAAALLIGAARAFGDRTAIRLDHTVLSYVELEDASARAADLLARSGVRPGDRVGLMLPNHPSFAVYLFAALRAGAIAVPINVVLKRREVAGCLATTGARVLVAWHACAAAAPAGLTTRGRR